MECSKGSRYPLCGRALCARPLRSGWPEPDAGESAVGWVCHAERLWL